jgi:hypothetical protein
MLTRDDRSAEKNLVVIGLTAIVGLGFVAAVGLGILSPDQNSDPAQQETPTDPGPSYPEATSITIDSANVGP